MCKAYAINHLKAESEKKNQVSRILKFYYLFYTFSWFFRVPKEKSRKVLRVLFTPLFCFGPSLKPAYVVYETFAFLSETPYLLLVFLRALPPNEPGIYFHVVIEKNEEENEGCA
jgi:hypothetical protein